LTYQIIGFFDTTVCHVTDVKLTISAQQLRKSQ